MSKGKGDTDVFGRRYQPAAHRKNKSLAAPSFPRHHCAPVSVPKLRLTGHLYGGTLLGGRGWQVNCVGAFCLEDTCKGTLCWGHTNWSLLPQTSLCSSLCSKPLPSGKTVCGDSAGGDNCKGAYCWEDICRNALCWKKPLRGHAAVGTPEWMPSSQGTPVWVRSAEGYSCVEALCWGTHVRRHW